MNYKTFKRSLATTALGAVLWTYAGTSGSDSTPGRVIEQAYKGSTIDAIVEDVERSSPLGLAGRTLTYGGLASASLSLIASKKKKQE